jgi:hypothetical protein
MSDLTMAMTILLRRERLRLRVRGALDDIKP